MSLDPFQCNFLVPEAVVRLVTGVTKFTGSQEPKNTQSVAERISVCVLIKKINPYLIKTVTTGNFFSTDKRTNRAESN